MARVHRYVSLTGLEKNFTWRLMPMTLAAEKKEEKKNTLKINQRHNSGAQQHDFIT